MQMTGKVMQIGQKEQEPSTMKWCLDVEHLLAEFPA